jgi:ferredoxin-thioredoxin reductase catalytic chain
MEEDKDTEEQAIQTWALTYAKNHRWVLNPDEKKLSVVIRGLARNKRKFGEHYCPCRLRSGDKEKDTAIICPCIYHKDEVEKDGSCHCQLYFRKDAPRE